MNVYACGGCGINISKLLTDLDINVYRIDTSKSNLEGKLTPNDFIMEELDGAGKDRRRTYGKMKEEEITKEILFRFKPDNEVNIVLSSLAGGSGSVISPMLVKELLDNDCITIAVGIDSQTSRIEILNTINTLKSFYSISKSVNKTVPLYFIENKKRDIADKAAVNLVNLFSLLTNKYTTKELDINDIKNFLQIEKLTNNDPTLGFITVNENTCKELPLGVRVASSILITNQPGSSISEPIPDYLSTCIVDDRKILETDVRVDILSGYSEVLINHLSKQLKDFEEEQKKKTMQKTFVVEPNTDDGLVL